MVTVNPRELLIEMFEQMVKRKDASLIERYYHPDFLLHTNGAVQGYEEFADGHRRVYATEISYAVDYDEKAWVVTDDRVAGRVWITTERPGEEPTKQHGIGGRHARGIGLPGRDIVERNLEIGTNRIPVMAGIARAKAVHERTELRREQSDAA